MQYSIETMQKACLCFLGERQYLQSTTLFDYLMKTFPVHGKISYKINELIYSPCVSISSEHSEEVKASLAFGDNLEYCLYISESTCPENILREPYDENRILEQADFNELSASFIVLPDETFMRSLVAVNKELHQRFFSLTNGKWLFVRLDLSALPKQDRKYEIKMTNYERPHLTATKIFQDAQELGTLYFSWK